MADRLKGITIEIDGNTTGLSKALKNVNSEVSSTSAKLRDVERLLKLDPNNTELLAQKQKLLANQIQNTKSKLDTLKTAAEQAAEQMKSGDKEAEEQYEALRREIIHTEQNLNRLEAESEKTGNELKDAGKDGKKGLDDAGDAADRVSNKMRTLSNVGRKVGTALAAGLVAVGTAAVAAAKGLTDMAIGAAEYADEILTASTVTGISTDNLQAYSYAAELVDVSLETLTKSMAKNVKSMSNAANGSKNYAAAYEQLGISVTDANGNLRDSETVYWEAIDALGQIENETERDAIAMQLFGKSAQELNPLIEQGSEGIAALTDEARAMGAVLDSETLSALGQFDDSIQRIKSGSTALKNTLGTVLLPQMQEISDGLVNIIGDVTNGLQDADGDWSAITDTLSNGLAEAFDLLGDKASDMVGVVSKASPKMIKTIGNLAKDAVKQVSKITPDLIDVLTDMVPELASTASEVAVDVGAAVIEKSPEILLSIGEAIIDSALTTFKSIGDIFSDTDDILDEALENLESYATSFESFSDKIATASSGMLDFNDLVSESGRTASEIDSAISEAEQSIYDILKDKLSAQQELRDEDIQKIQEYNDKIRELEQEKVGIYQDTQKGIIKKSELAASDGLTAAEVTSLVAEAQAAHATAYDQIEASYTQELTHIENLKTMGGITEEQYNKMATAAKTAHDSQIADTESYYYSVIGTVSSKMSEWAQVDSNGWNTLSAQFEYFRQNSEGITGWFMDKMLSMSAAGDELKTSYVNALQTMDLQTGNAFLSMAAEAVNGGIQLDASTRSTAASIISAFDGLPKELDEAGRSALDSLINGLNFPELENSASMSTDEIVSVLKDKFLSSGEDAGFSFTNKFRDALISGEIDAKQAGEGIADNAALGSDTGIPKARTSGKKFGAGFINGMNAYLQPAYNTGFDIGQNAAQGLHDGIDEGSPSRITTKSGKFFGEGFENGMKMKMPDIKAVADQIASVSIGAVNSPLTAVMPDYKSLTGSTSNVTHNSSSTTHIAGITVNVNASNVDNVDGLADLVADRINDSILERKAMFG